MAQPFDPNLEEDQEQQEGQSSSSGSSTGSGPAATIAKPTVQKGPTSSGRFTNIQNYIQASRAGAAKQAQELGQKLSSGAEQTKLNIGKAGTAAQTEVGGVKQQVLGKQQAASQGVADLSQYQQPAPSTQEQLASKEAQIAEGLGEQFKSDIAAKKIQDEANLLKSALAAQERAAATTSESGRTQLLKETFGRPTYTAGQQKLDQLLLGSSQSNLGELVGARQKARELTPELQRQKEALENLKQQYSSELGAGREALISEITRQSTLAPEGQPADLSTLSGRLMEAAKQANIQAEQAKEVTSKDILEVLSRPELSNLLTVDPTTGTVRLKGSDLLTPRLNLESLAPAITSSSGAVANLQNINPEALSRLNVLRRLSEQAELSPGSQYEQSIKNALKTDSKGNTFISALQNATVKQKQEIAKDPQLGKLYNRLTEPSAVEADKYTPEAAHKLFTNEKSLKEIAARATKDKGYVQKLLHKAGPMLSDAQYASIVSYINKNRPYDKSGGASVKQSYLPKQRNTEYGNDSFTSMAKQQYGWDKTLGSRIDSINKISQDVLDSYKIKTAGTDTRKYKAV